MSVTLRMISVVSRELAGSSHNTQQVGARAGQNDNDCKLSAECHEK